MKSDPDQLASITAPAEPFAFALITWPAAAAAALPSSPETTWWQLGAMAWLALFHLAAYGRGRGAAFGNLTLLMSVVVAAAAAGFPSAWSFAAFPLLLIGLHGAQRALLRARHDAPGIAPGDPPARRDSPAQRPLDGARRGPETGNG